MRIGGFQKFSMIDFPGRICAVVFTQGCNFRCPFCHNPELVIRSQFGPTLDEDGIFRFLESRQGKIDGLTITGGEPTLQYDLLQFIKQVKALSFQVKLDTNGYRPAVIQKALEQNLVDFIAMDIKAPLHDYHTLCGIHINSSRIEESVALIQSSGIEYQFRTTVVPGLHTDLMTDQIQAWMGSMHARHIFQEFIPSKTLDPSLMETRPAERHLEPASI